MKNLITICVDCCIRVIAPIFHVYNNNCTKVVIDAWTS